MKKIISSLLIAVLMSVSFAAVAAETTNGYFSTKKPQTLTASSGNHHHTNITVVNASFSTIYATVPNSPVYDMLYPNETDHIYNNNPNVFWTHLRILDSTQNFRHPIFDGDVCPHAIVTIAGGPGAYSINVNSNGC